MKKIVLPDLLYAYGDLEPVIQAEVMHLHHAKHHQAYVNQYNLFLEKQELAIETNDTQLALECASNLRFHGGGHVNHAFFWQGLSPMNECGGKLPQGSLKEAIDRSFGSLEKFIELFNARTVAIQGSGWGWLAMDLLTRQLLIMTSQDQEVLSSQYYLPLLNIDVWEHAYYLQYKNARVSYLESIWKIINWKKVEKRFLID